MEPCIGDTIRYRCSEHDGCLEWRGVVTQINEAYVVFDNLIGHNPDGDRYVSRLLFSKFYVVTNSGITQDIESSDIAPFSKYINLLNQGFFRDDS